MARFGLLTALALVLGLLDRAIPLTALLGGAAPGIKLGLANTVLLYAVYLMDWQSAVFLMFTKVLLSGFLFGCSLRFSRSENRAAQHKAEGQEKRNEFLHRILHPF